MFCKNCGVENADSVNFCKSCGGSTGGSQQNINPNNYGAISGGNQKSAWDYYLTIWRKYAVFSGRAQRSEYWYAFMFNIIFLIVAVVLDNILGTAIAGVGYGLFYFVYSLAVLVPGLAVGVRRLHDTGNSGWMLLVSLIPIAGPIWLLILMATDSNPGNNQYGPNPKRIMSS